MVPSSSVTPASSPDARTESPSARKRASMGKGPELATLPVLAFEGDPVSDEECGKSFDGQAADICDGLLRQRLQDESGGDAGAEGSITAPTTGDTGPVNEGKRGGQADVIPMEQTFKGVSGLIAVEDAPSANTMKDLGEEVIFAAPRQPQAVTAPEWAMQHAVDIAGGRLDTTITSFSPSTMVKRESSPESSPEKLDRQPFEALELPESVKTELLKFKVFYSTLLRTKSVILLLRGEGWNPDGTKYTRQRDGKVLDASYVPSCRDCPKQKHWDTNCPIYLDKLSPVLRAYVSETPPDAPTRPLKPLNPSVLSHESVRKALVTNKGWQPFESLSMSDEMKAALRKP
ncbi:hypothetical protein HK405_016095 [Cladochytrium tenue]|nr:hypothetical protein HK405_016095 [Cladochytrium tenue]